MAEGKEEEKGPSLHLAADRIRPDYMERWVALPRRLVPYTSMTQYQPFWAHLKEPMTPDQRAPLLEAEYAMTPEDRVRAVRDALLEKAQQQPYDLGLLDLRMPGMDGLTLCRHLKRLHPRMVTMIITAYTGNSLEEEACDAGARHVLSKPIDFPRLMALVERALPPDN
jgi:CheY-like chemotaxis protein